MIGLAGPRAVDRGLRRAHRGQDPESLSELGAALSGSGAAAVTVLVHDSDILQLGLFQDGTELDRYDNYPNY